MTMYRIGDKAPRVAGSAFIAREAVLIGDVAVGERGSVWPGATLRGDNEPIAIGPESSIQEGAVLHADPGFPLTIGVRVTVGHQAMLHGCTVGDGTLIGVQAVVLNGAVIGRNCIVGAGALITERKVFPDNALIVGAPAVLKRSVTEEDLRRVAEGLDVYVHKAELYRTSLEALD